MPVLSLAKYGNPSSARSAQMSEPNQQIDQDATAGWLTQAMTRMIRPVVRFAVGRVSCGALIELIREVYVSEARAYLVQSNPDRKVTRSALALLSGMDGRAIKAFETNDERQFAVSDLCSEAAILEVWQSDPDFSDSEQGSPRELLIHGPHGTFQRLVSRAAGRAVTPQTALDRLIASGNVELNKAGTKVRMIDPCYMLVPESEKSAIEAGSLGMNRLGKVVLHNTNRFRQGRDPWLQQDRWSLRIPRDRLDLIRNQLRALLETHIGQVEEVLDDEERRPSDGIENAVGIGWYYWEDPSGEDPVKHSASKRRESSI